MSEIEQQPVAAGRVELKGKAATNVRWYIFVVVFLLVVINMVDRTALSIAMPSIAAEFSLGPAMQGLILSSFFWSYALMQIPGGMLIDRFGARSVITVSTLGWGIFQTIAGFTTGGISLLLTRIGLGAAEAPLFPAGAKLNSIWLSKRERARGAVFMDSGAPLGAAIGGVLISWLILTLGSWRLAFIVAGLVTILLGWLAWRYLRDNPSTHPGINATEMDIINEVGQPKSEATESEPTEILRRSIVSLVAGRAGWAMINFGLLTWGPSYLAQARNFNLKEMGGATFVIFLAGMLGSLASGFVADKLVAAGFKRSVVYKLLLGITGLGVAATFIALPHVSSPVAAVALLSATLFLLYFGSLYWSLPSILAPKSRVGVIGGTMNFAGSVSGIIVPILTGFILQWTGGSYGTVLGFFAGCAVVYVIATLTIDFNEGTRERKGS